MECSKNRPKLDWLAIGVVGVVHLLALSAMSGWLFSWTGVALAVIGAYVFGTLGINLGFHRLLSHRSFKCPLWFEHLLALLGVCCLEKTPGQFVATHRAHHQHTDKVGDPHSPLVTFFWGHMGWLLVDDQPYRNSSSYDKYARDIFQDSFYMRLERNFLWLWVFAIHAGIFLVVGFGVSWFRSGGTIAECFQFGLSLLVWGVFVRIVLVWHITWSVNSLGHVWGYRNYDTSGNARNSLLVGLLSNGDGWHNNHHADQRAASHGHKWWEIDVTYATLLALERFGLAWDLVPVTVNQKATTDKPSAARNDGQQKVSNLSQ